MTSTYFKEILQVRESELRSILANNPNIIEDGLTVLKQEYPTDEGPLDLLCVDGEGRLAVVELKVDSEDTMLFQALKYYDWVYSNRDRVKEAFKDKKINTNLEPKIILIAPEFSETLIRSVKHVTPVIDLYTYKMLECSECGRKGVHLSPITVEEPESPPELPRTLDDYINYVKEPKAKETLITFIDKVKNIGEGIQFNPTKSFISVFFKGKRIAVIVPKRTFFYVYLTRRSSWTDRTRVEKKDDYSDIYQKIENFYNELKTS
jgi:hypothetical protein